MPETLQTEKLETSFNGWVYRKVNSLLDEISECCYRGILHDRSDKCFVEIGAAIFQIRQTLRNLTLDEKDIHPTGADNAL